MNLEFGTLAYIGGQPYVFAEAVSTHQNFYWGRLRFPVFTAIVHMGSVEPVKRVSHHETMFGSFLKDLYTEGGWFFIILSALVVVPGSILLLRITGGLRGMEIPHLLFPTLYFQTISQGVFYYTLGSRSGNIYTGVMLIFVFIGVIHYMMVRRRVGVG